VAGKWQTKPAMVSFTDAGGKPEPENIRDWMSLQEISGGYGIPLPMLYERAGLPAGIPATARLNTIAKDYNMQFEPDKVREIVRAHLQGGVPVGQASRQEESGKEHLTRAGGRLWKRVRHLPQTTITPPQARR
jgi:hypothetical protein